MIQINSPETFKNNVLEASVPVLVDFYADWCGPCKMQAPILDELSQELGDTANICKLNVDQNRDLAVEYEIQSIPTILIFQNGQVKESMVGLQNKDKLKKSLGL
jgi:thioredoxin 1